jgi:hypothetical protein
MRLNTFVEQLRVSLKAFKMDTDVEVSVRVKSGDHDLVVDRPFTGDCVPRTITRRQVTSESQAQVERLTAALANFMDRRLVSEGLMREFLVFSPQAHVTVGKILKQRQQWSEQLVSKLGIYDVPGGVCLSVSTLLTAVVELRGLQNLTLNIVIHEDGRMSGKKTNSVILCCSVLDSERATLCTGWTFCTLSRF